MNNKRIKNKRVIFVFFLVFLSTLTVMIEPAKAFGNSDDNGRNESLPGLFTFYLHQRKYTSCETDSTFRQQNSYHFQSYGVHDWVADSALKVILEDETYRDKVKWLFMSSSGSDYKKSSIDLTDLELGLHRYTYKGDDWYCYKYFSSTSNLINEKDRYDQNAWVKLRRYVTFLHGTAVPDNAWRLTQDPAKDIDVKKIKPQYIIINDPGMEDQHVYDIYTLNSGTHKIKFRFDENQDGKLYIQDNPAAQKARKCGQQAKDFLASDEGSPIKYEAAAWTLGMMTHWISDLAHPAHVTLSSKWASQDNGGYYLTPFRREYHHRWWDHYFVDENDRSLRVGIRDDNNGETNWNNVNPKTYFTSNSLKLKMISPYTAVKTLAENTFTANDIYGKMTHKPEKWNDYEKYEDIDWNDTPRPLASAHPGFSVGYDEEDSEYGSYVRAEHKQRMKDLLCRAVYYCACAMLHVLDDIDFAEDTTANLGMAGRDEVEVDSSVPSATPESEEDIQEEQDQVKEGTGIGSEEEDDRADLMSLGISLGSATVVIALVVIPYSVKCYGKSKSGGVPAAA